MTGRSSTPRPGTPRGSTPRPGRSGSRNPPRFALNTAGPSTSTSAPSQVRERLSPAIQTQLIDSWLSDQNDLNHAKPAVFWASEDWDRDVVQRDFLDTLKQVVTDEYPRIQRSIHRLSGERWRIPYLTWETVYERPVKKDFWYLWFHQDWIDNWSLDLIKEWFIYLKDEAYWAEDFKKKCEGREDWLELNPDSARYHPPGFIPKRRSPNHP